jgi:hypothetical protein
MTLPKSEHSDNFRQTIEALLQAIGDSAIDERPFQTTEFPDVMTTTWEDLQAAELVERLSGTDELLLTGRGWVAGVLITHQYDEQTFAERIAKLFAELKSHVKGRKAAKVVPLKTDCYNNRHSGRMDL